MTKFKRQYLGVDIGGTTISLGRYDCDGNILSFEQIKTPKPALPGVVTVALYEALNNLDPNREADYVGIALPGPMDPTFRIARICINLPGWTDVPLASWLESRLNRKVTLANDGNCALLGESWKGAARGFKDVVLLTLGTGVGGGVMINGSLFLGHNGAASEPGLIGLWPDGPSCNSGNQGSLEQFASVSAIKRKFNLDPITLFNRAELGDKSAIQNWKIYGKELGIGISTLVYLFTPQLVLLGGGISSAATYFLPAVLDEVEKRVQPISREGLQIRTCELGNKAGSFGAALTAMQRI